MFRKKRKDKSRQMSIKLIFSHARHLNVESRTLCDETEQVAEASVCARESFLIVTLSESHANRANEACHGQKCVTIKRLNLWPFGISLVGTPKNACAHNRTKYCRIAHCAPTPPANNKSLSAAVLNRRPFPSPSGDDITTASFHKKHGDRL